MNASLTCPRCRTENVAEQRFCQKCGFGLYKTDSLEPPFDLGDRPENLIGRVIGDKYRILSVLGEGGFGVVFKVEQVLLGRNLTFALKLLHKELTANDHFRARFIREASIAMELVHPNAIQVRDFGVTDADQLYFTMDFCRGESLKEVIAREGYLTINRAVHIMREILAVLEVAHEKQIIHRDIKPENIFIERDSGVQEDRVKVGDFGLARNVAPGSQSSITKGGIVGTPRYMSPEQSKGEALDGRSDLYAVGVVFYELISGDVPPRLDRKRKSGQSSIEVTPQARLRENLPEGVVIPGAVIELIARSLENKPGARFRNATEFREALEVLPTYTPTYIEPRSEPRRSWLTSSGTWVIAAVLVFAALIAFTAPGQRVFSKVRQIAFGSPNAKADGGDKGNRSGVRRPAEGDRETPNPGTKPSDDLTPKDDEDNTTTDDNDEPNTGDIVSAGDSTNVDDRAVEDAGSTGDTGEASATGSAEVSPQSPRLGELDDWVPIHPLAEITFERVVGGTNAEPQRVPHRVGASRGVHGHRIKSEAGSEQRYWSVDDQQFRETWVDPGESSKVTQWSYLQWDPETGRPLTTGWNNNGYVFSVSEEVQPNLTIGDKRFRDVIEVTGVNSEGGIVKCYFEKGTGLVVKERYQVTRDAKTGESYQKLGFREVRVLPVTTPRAD